MPKLDNRDSHAAHGRLQVEHVGVQRPGPSVPTERVGRTNRSVRAMIVLAAAFIALASLKPWNAGTGGPPRPGTAPAAVATSALDRFAAATLAR